MARAEPLGISKNDIFRLLTWALTAALALVILALTLSPRPIVLADFNQADKLYHLAAFAALIMPTALWRPHRIAWTIAAGLILGLGIEIIQPHVGREGSALDFLADALGLALGAACGWLLRRLLARN